MAGIYVHIPFCSQFCIYCNFYSVKGKELREKYVDSLFNEIEYRKDFFRNIGALPQTVYFGGGTPSLFPPDILGRLLSTLKRVFDFTPVEATIEVNPNDITPEYALALRKAGFNRVSMGVQSFHNTHLEWMNRRHKGEEAVQAFNDLRGAGFDNISLDLIFGYQGLGMEQWQSNIEKMVSLSPEHISAYQMSIEEGSLLHKNLQRGEYNLVPDNICREQYSQLQKMLAQNGYTQYEISNFAAKDPKGNLMVSRHNSSYWTKEPYLGLGPAAHSYNGSHRFWNGSNLTAYCRHYLKEVHNGTLSKDSYSAGGKSGFGDFEELSAEDIFNESVMLGLRTVSGVALTTLNPSLLGRVMKEIKRHCTLGNLIMEGNKIRIPSDQLFVSDGIIMDLFV